MKYYYIVFLVILILIIESVSRSYREKRKFILTKNLYNTIKDNDIKLPDIEESDDIPYHIIQTHKSIDEVPQKIIDNIKKNNPQHKYYFYDNEECKLFLKNNFSNEFLKKFEEFKLGPHKSDLFRLCWLYLNGGTYIDIDTEMLKPLEYIHNNIKSKLIIPYNNFKSNIYSDTINTLLNNKSHLLINSFIMCNKGNKQIGECIKNIIQITQKDIDKYGYTLLLCIMQRTLGKNFKYQIYEKESKPYLLTSKRYMYDQKGVILMNPKYENYEKGNFKL